MYKNKTFLAIIPARGGSKRLPRKNMLDTFGKPLIGWTIEAALNSKYIDEVLVTSDDDEILNISRTLGCHVLKRTDELSSDTASTFDVVQHAINQNQKQFDYIILLQPTSPLRNSNQIDQAIEYLDQKRADAIISVTKTDHHPLWSNSLPENENMINFLRKDVLNKRSQDLEPFYRINGAIYICKVNRLLNEKSFYLKDNIFAFKMDRETSVDIDEAFDLEFASFLLSKYK